MAAFAESASMKIADTVQDPFLSKICADLDGLDKGVDNKDKVRNKDLTKTKLCMYFLQGKCGLGSNCQFAHSSTEIRHCPNLTKTQLCPNFMKGRCSNQNCTYAHGEAELVNPPSFKKKPCAWFKQGKCRNGVNCGFIHDLSLCVANAEPVKLSQKISVLAPGGLSQLKPWKKDCEFDYEASTDVPSSVSQAESDISMRTNGPVPQEHLFRMMAGRGSAPVQQQVKSMSLAIGDLKAKLAQVQGRRQAASNTAEGLALQKQVDEMQHAIQQLSTQCEAMETKLHATQPATQPSFNTVRSNAPWQQKPGTDGRSPKGIAPDDITSATTTLPLPRQRQRVRPESSLVKSPQSSLVKNSKGSYQFGVRAALCVLVFAVMVALEMGFQYDGDVFAWIARLFGSA